MSVVDQIRSGLSGDVLITTGGVSMGEKVKISEMISYSVMSTLVMSYKKYICFSVCIPIRAHVIIKPTLIFFLRWECKLNAAEVQYNDIIMTF